MSLEILFLTCLPIVMLSKLNGPQNPPSQKQWESGDKTEPSFTSEALVYVDETSVLRVFTLSFFLASPFQFTPFTWQAGEDLVSRLLSLHSL